MYTSLTPAKNIIKKQVAPTTRAAPRSGSLSNNPIMSRATATWGRKPTQKLLMVPLSLFLARE